MDVIIQANSIIQLISKMRSDGSQGQCMLDIWDIFEINIRNCPMN
jgi:hypothetical protein